VQQWDLMAANAQSGTGPRVLFSTSEARGVVIDLDENEVMGDHQVRERAVVEVVYGAAAFTSGADTVTGGEGALIVFEPSETHSVTALQPTRLLLLLTPWPAPGHYAAAENENPHELPANATEPRANDRSQ
jgi:quercetin dioxygenase-like cupin family protein